MSVQNQGAPAGDAGAQSAQMSAYSSLDALISGPSSEEPATEASDSQDANAEGQEMEGEAQEGEAGEAEAETPEADEWEFTVTDATGKKAIKFDLNDKERIKKALPLAYAARDFQRRANSAEDKLKNIEPELEQMKGRFAVLNKAWEERGEEGVIDVLGGEEGFAAKWLEARFNKMREYESASPSERTLLELQEENAKARAELERERKLRQQESEKLAQDKDEAETISLENQLHPHFNKYRFAGKLGDPESEGFYDQAIWKTALDELSKLPDHEVTSQRIELEFKRTYEKAARAIQKKADDKAKKVIETKKKEALSTAKVTAKKAMKGATQEDKLRENIKKGGSGWVDAILGSI